MSKSLLLILSFLTLCGSIVSAQVDNYSAGLNGQKFDWMLFYLDEHYVDDVDLDSLTSIAIRSVAEQLDPFTVYQTTAEVEQQTNADKGYSGKAVGFSFYMVHDTAVVTYINDKGPADLGGLKRGDQILAMNSKPMTNVHYSVLNELMDNQEIEDYNLDVLRSGQAYSVSFTKDLIPWTSVKAAYMMTDRIGYIKIGKFTLKTMEEFVPSLSYLTSLGMQELVLDLRGNNGGVVEQAYQLADQFLREGQLVYAAEGINMEREEFTATAKGGWVYGKLAVLQDDYTASASEVFIGAMQDWDRAVILGVTTYGKGLIQQSYKLGDGSNIRITIGRYTTPTGRPLLRTRAEAEDVMLPYKSALRENSLTSSLDLPDDLIKQSKSGRRFAAGDGGIVPDIHYVYEPKETDTFYDDMNSAGLLYQFATEYLHAERKDMISRFNSVNAMMEDRLFEAFMLQRLRIFLKEKKPYYVLPKNFPDKVVNQLKTWMVSQLWHDNAYYEAENADDRLLWRAREVMEGEMHDKLGINYKK